jgi:hypothetical protein
MIRRLTNSRPALEHSTDRFCLTNKHEPVDFLGDRIILVNFLAGRPQRGHSLFEIVI